MYIHAIPFKGIKTALNLMSNIYILANTVMQNNSDLLLDILFVFSIYFAISVVIKKNPVVSVLFLIGLFFSIASYLMLSGIQFIGLAYLLVYVGAVSILFLFILMLINVRVSELVTDNNNSIPLSIIVMTIFIMIFQNTNYIFYSFGNNFSKVNGYMYDNIHLVSSISWETALSHISHISNIGSILYTSYPILLFITSLVLLLAMVGSIIITIKQQ